MPYENWIKIAIVAAFIFVTLWSGAIASCAQEIKKTELKSIVNEICNGKQSNESNRQ